MKKRLLALVLCLATAIALIPAMPAEATVLPGMTSKVDYDNTDPNRYTIEIDLVNQIITVYEGAIGGPIVLQSLCTTGNEENPTGAGTFKLGQLKERFGYFVAFGQYAQYWTQVVRGIYIHSVMYNSEKIIQHVPHGIPEAWRKPFPRLRARAAACCAMDLLQLPAGNHLQDRPQKGSGSGTCEETQGCDPFLFGL